MLTSKKLLLRFLKERRLYHLIPTDKVGHLLDIYSTRLVVSYVTPSIVRDSTNCNFVTQPFIYEYRKFVANQLKSEIKKILAETVPEQWLDKFYVRIKLFFLPFKKTVTIDDLFNLYDGTGNILFYIIKHSKIGCCDMNKFNNVINLLMVRFENLLRKDLDKVEVKPNVKKDKKKKRNKKRKNR